MDELFSDDDPEDPPVDSVDSGSYDAAASHCPVPITWGALDLPPGELSDSENSVLTLSRHRSSNPMIPYT